MTSYMVMWLDVMSVTRSQKLTVPLQMDFVRLRKYQREDVQARGYIQARRYIRRHVEGLVYTL